MHEDVLRDVSSLFRGASAACLDGLLRRTIEHRVAPGTVLFDQAELPNFQIVLVAGSLQLFGRSGTQREVLIEVVRAPDLVIPAAVMSASPYLLQARAPEASHLLLIEADAFREAVAAEPGLAQAVIATLARQFRRMVRQAKSLKLQSSTQRVGCYLLALSERQGTPGQAHLPYEKHIIASELGMTRESFSRALASLEPAGLRVEGQVIAILDRDRLAAVAQPDPLIDPDARDDGPDASSPVLSAGAAPLHRRS
ncbi:helix-turn-helix domain-containing protein [Methylobacterium aquaticum]|jgi:CRP/FNR family transcriptional activator FtrB|uniref:Crp/Fnr family transcriptional regulator n=1 Tax=Methylobacterium aquaticum TaxID=270351 RepID=A0A0J6VCG6_9HYPH|nr:helix-turn-helix domain-containing protein [Methylobacterium aquaticum]KMO36751.1 Crp/Fnr family transcriptional regulator [Methylobacterium aquaticum]